MCRMMNTAWVVGVSVWFALTTVGMARQFPSPAVVELFEDEADTLARNLNNDNGVEPGTATRADKERYSGRCSLQVTPLQRYNSRLPGWNFPIREKPKAGEYRYLRFAWKKVGEGGIMVQLHGDLDGKAWEHRYLAGAPNVPWPARKLADRAPANWEVVTCDLFKDFGNFDLTGMAFTPMVGTAGYYDHIYLARSVADLDRVSNAVLGKDPVKTPLTKQQLDQCWRDLLSADALLHAVAIAQLSARPSESLPFLKQHLQTPPDTDGEKRLAKWIADLDDDDFEVREKASRALAEAGEDIAALLRRAYQTSNSAEVRARLEKLLKGNVGEGLTLTPQQTRLVRVIGVLERTGTDEARHLLQELAKGSRDAHLQAEAKGALQRLGQRSRDKREERSR